MSNFDEIKLMIISRDVDVMCISETWLLPNISSNLIYIPNYNVLRKDRGRGGGVCIYVKDSLRANPVLINNVSHPNIEDIYVTIQYNKLPAILLAKKA